MPHSIPHLQRLMLILFLLVGTNPWCSNAADERPSVLTTTKVAAEKLPTTVHYNRDVRPILAEYCFACHGPDSAAREADLRLDQAEAALHAGAIVPHDIAGSEVLRRIGLPANDDERMPPTAGHKKLDEYQSRLLARWIEQGAEYERHWSFVPPERPPVPEVKDRLWGRNPIDQFVLAKLEERGLSVAPEADRESLARRLALDIIGLPPEPWLVAQIVNDAHPDSYARYVDNLMASKHWGEHRGRYWLDYARYGDTHGIHVDNYREMWSYRDNVIDAFNRNLPFDEFTIEQLAGDLIPTPTLEQEVASGFNRCNITTNEGGIIDEEYRVLYARDRTETTAAVWMGLTVGCAVCHDHKFDPITQRDFYSLAAFFNNTTQPVRDGNISDTPPVVTVPLPEDRERFDAAELARLRVQAEVDEARSAARVEFDAQADRLDRPAIEALAPTDNLVLHALLNESSAGALSFVLNGKLRLSLAQSLKGESEVTGQTSPRAVGRGEYALLPANELGVGIEFDKPFSLGAWVYLNKEGTVTKVVATSDPASQKRGFSLFIDNDRVGVELVNKWPSDALKVVTREALPIGKWHHLFVVYDGSRKFDGLHIVVDGENRTDRTQRAKTLTQTIRSDANLVLGESDSSATYVNDLRIYDRELTSDEVKRVMLGSRLAYLVQKSASTRSSDESEELFDYWIKSYAPRHSQAVATLTAIDAELDEMKKRGTVAHVMHEKEMPASAHILNRGEYDQPLDEVVAATPVALPAMTEHFPKNRLGLANWLVSDEHPLMARVTVNRLWQEIFGAGLVATSGDFGVSGELPSHPELLDWLAVEFRESGWDVKHMVRLMVTSSTYRQAAITTPQKLQIDPDNRWLSHGPRYRMDAEMIRDYALATSGLLINKVGGKSVKPYQPDGVWEAVAIQSSDTRFYEPGTGEDLYRRSMYTFWKRSAPPAAMEIFNAPSREFCAVRRERTNTPLQALVTLNDPQFVEAARHVATNAMRQHAATSERIDAIAARVLCRALREDEQQILRRSLKKLSEYFESHEADARALLTVGESAADDQLPPHALAAFTMLAQHLLNVDEVLNQ